MRCSAYECKNNENGYCGCPDYVVIDEDGKCGEYWEPIKENLMSKADDIIEFAEKHGYKLVEWQKELLRKSDETGKRLYMVFPPRYGRLYFQRLYEEFLETQKELT